MSEESQTLSRLETLIDVGSAIGCGVIAALVGSGPAALRLASTGTDRTWLLLAACATPFTAIAVAVFRESYAGLRSFMGEERGVLRVFVALWLVVAAPLLFVLGSVLRAHTHHRPLAGATFALVAFAILLGGAAFAHRGARLVEAIRSAGHVRTHALVASVIYTLVFALLLLGARRLHAQLPVESAATMIDITALGLASALAARPELRAVRLLATFGPVAAVALLLFGLSAMSTELAVMLNERAPTFEALHAVLRP